MTTLVTDYRYRQPRHNTTPFTIEVEYCTKEEIDEQLQELLIGYRDRWRVGLEQELSDSDKDFQAIEKRPEVTLETL